jgi:hypothetical protein
VSTATASKLTRQDYDDLFDAWNVPGDLRDAITAVYGAVEGIITRHVERALEAGR